MYTFVIRKNDEKYKHNTDENITTLPMVPSTSNLEEYTYKIKKNQFIGRRYDDNFLKFRFCAYYMGDNALV